MSEINLSDLPKTEIVDVHIASPGARVTAYLLNNLFNVLIWVPFIVMVVFTFDESEELVSESSLSNTPDYAVITFFISLAVYLVFGIFQLYYMSRDGQSLGKKIMGIRVLKSDGSNPGRWLVLLGQKRMRRQFDDTRIGQHIVERAAVAFDGEEHDKVDESHKQRNQISTCFIYCQHYRNDYNTDNKCPSHFAYQNRTTETRIAPVTF